MFDLGIIFGNPEVTPGGRALKFYSSLRIDLRKADTIKVGTRVVGTRIRAKVVKNKVAAPFNIMFEEGISREGNLLDLGVEMEIVRKTGAFFSYGEIRLGQGRENAKEFLKQDTGLAEEIERQIRATEVAHTDAPPAPTVTIEPAPADATA